MHWCVCLFDWLMPSGVNDPRNKEKKNDIFNIVYLAHFWWHPALDSCSHVSRGVCLLSRRRRGVSFSGFDQRDNGQRNMKEAVHRTEVRGHGLLQPPVIIT